MGNLLDKLPSMNRYCIALALLFCAIHAPEAAAGLGLKGMRVIDTSLVPQMSPPEHFQAGREAFQEHDFPTALYHFRIITHNFPKARWAPESYFRQGMCQYWMGELEEANELLSRYLKSQGTPEYFRTAVEAKFHIAEQFREGKRRRAFSTRCFPKWAGGEMLALEIYDEVASLVPCERLAAQSYYGKGKLLESITRIKEAVHSYQTVIRQFPKDELAVDAYVAIAELYRRQSELEFQNPDLLELARINVRRFELDFPKDPRVNYVKAMMLQTEEIHAHGLYDTARIYERKSLPEAAAVYYRSAITAYPNTKIADSCRERLERLGLESSVVSNTVPTEP